MVAAVGTVRAALETPVGVQLPLKVPATVAVIAYDPPGTDAGQFTVAPAPALQDRPAGALVIAAPVAPPTTVSAIVDVGAAPHCGGAGDVPLQRS